MTEMSGSRLRALLDYIYKAPPNTPHCAHCGRPLLLVKKDGETWLFCKRCADLAAEEKEK